MKAVILAGGAGTRLRAAVPGLPKPMAPVGKRPFLEYLVDQLVSAGVRDIVLATGYRAEAIEAHFADGSRWGARIAFSREDSPLGTGGAFREAARRAGGGDLLVMNGDSFLDLPLPSLLAFHAARPGGAALALAHRDDTSRYGRVDLAPDGRVTAFHEKGAGGPGWINGGVYLFPAALAGELPGGPLSLEREVLPGLVGRGLWGFPVRGFFIDIGVPEDYLAACRDPGRLSPAAGVGRNP